MKLLILATIIGAGSLSQAVCRLPDKFNLSGNYSASQFTAGGDGIRAPALGTAQVKFTKVSREKYIMNVERTSSGQEFKFSKGKYLFQFLENVGSIEFCDVLITDDKNQTLKYQAAKSNRGFEISQWTQLGGGDLGTGGTFGISFQ